MDLYEYTDYRKYLKDFYLEQKARNSGYSYRVFAKKAKLVSPNYLKLVIDGKRGVTHKNIHQFVRGLGLNKASARYFRCLVLHQATKDVDAKAGYLNKLVRLRRKSKTEAQEITKDHYEIARKWHHWAIREMVLLDDFSPDPAWIAERLKQKITPKEAEESLKLLERLGFIRNENGRWVLSQPLISTPDEVSVLLIRDLHRQFIELGIQSVFNDPIEAREINGLTLALPRSKVSELKQMIKAFRKELNQVFSSCSHNEEVYHLVINLFPLTGGSERRRAGLNKGAKHEEEL